MQHSNNLTGWPYEPETSTETPRQAEELAQRRYLAQRDRDVTQALQLLTEAALDSRFFSLVQISAALRSVVEAYNQAAQANLSTNTILQL